MKTLKLITLLLFLLTIETYGQQNNNLLSTEINLPSDSIIKADLLDSISKLLNIHFSYNPELLNAHDKVKLSGEKQNLVNILSSITNPDVITFSVLDDQIIFYPVAKEVEKKVVQKEKIIILKGSVSDRKEKIAIPFCTIAIVGTGLGTVSNNDGNFQIKIPSIYLNDTLRFSCMGYIPVDVQITSTTDSLLEIMLEKSVFRMKTVEIVHYQPAMLLQKLFDNLNQNY